MGTIACRTRNKPASFEFQASVLTITPPEIPKDSLTQFQDNLIAWDIESWCRWAGVLVGQHYEVTMSVHKLVVVS